MSLSISAFCRYPQIFRPSTLFYGSIHREAWANRSETYHCSLPRAGMRILVDLLVLYRGAATVGDRFRPASVRNPPSHVVSCVCRDHNPARIAEKPWGVRVEDRRTPVVAPRDGHPSCRRTPDVRHRVDLRCCAVPAGQGNGYARGAGTFCHPGHAWLQYLFSNGRGDRVAGASGPRARQDHHVYLDCDHLRRHLVPLARAAYARRCLR